MRKCVPNRLFCRIAFLCIAATPLLATAQPNSDSIKSSESPPLASPPSTIWDTDVGAGFRPGTYTLEIDAGASRGVAIFGGRQAHDLALMSFNFGRVISEVQGSSHWYRGNWELRGELFAGAQFLPKTESVVGLAPHLRYNFATGTRWVPFVDAGAGVTATTIGHPDLSNTFEFNLQACSGVQWFLKDTCAVTFQARYLHMSCAGISSPNQGLNTFLGMVGVTWFF